jgi:ribosomal-protein-alanine N-acetyltransferase
MPEPPTVRTRKARASDIEAIMDIEAEQFLHPWKKHYFISELTHDISYFYAAEDVRTGRVAGYIVFWIIEETLELHHIAVAGQYKKKGIGKQLFRFMLDTAEKQKVTEIFLEVRASNTEVITFYESFHFQRIAVRKNYYESPREDASIYKLELGPRHTETNLSG